MKRKNQRNRTGGGKRNTGAGVEGLERRSLAGAGRVAIPGSGAENQGSMRRDPTSRFFGWTRRALRLAGALLCAGALAGCVREPVPSESSNKGARLPQQVLHGVHLRQTSLRGLLWVLSADSGISYGPDEPTRLKKLTVRFYDAGPEVKSTLTSRRGEVDDKTHSLVARDSVVVVTPKGERLETETLRWDPSKGQIQTNDPFRFYRGNDLMTGIGFQADPDLEHYVVHQQVRAEMRDEGDDQLREALDGDSTGRRHAPSH